MLDKVQHIIWTGLSKGVYLCHRLCSLCLMFTVGGLLFNIFHIILQMLLVRIQALGTVLTATCSYILTGAIKMPLVVFPPINWAPRWMLQAVTMTQLLEGSPFNRQVITPSVGQQQGRQGGQCGLASSWERIRIILHPHSVTTGIITPGT